MIGLTLLVLASDRVVSSAVYVSEAFGISRVLIGAVVVGVGTSIPELMVSGIASLDGRLDVAMANVVGSNTSNVTLVLGVAAILSPLHSQLRILNREGLLMLAAVMGLAAVLLDGQISVEEALVLVFGLLVALYFLVHWSLTDHAALELVADAPVRPHERPAMGRVIIVGTLAIAATVFGANLLLDGAISIGERLGFTATFLGLLLGVGTSLPELATAIAGVRRGEAELVFGNVLGSNLFNSLAVAGVAGLVGAGTLDERSLIALGFMIVTAVMAGLFSRTGQRIARTEGLVLLAGFVAYTVVAY